MSFRARAVLVSAVALGSALFSIVVACSDDPEVAGGSEAGAKADEETDGATGTADASTTDASRPADAGSDARDAARPKKDANGPGAADASCSFNADCQSALRCACVEGEGCTCAPGARGTGQNGIDTCNGGANGADCESALCLEGPGGTFYCSDECVTAADCTGKLPLCADISFVGRVCIRDPNP